jgi:hypothetical protein
MENLLEPSTPWRKQSNQVPLCSLWSGKLLLVLASTVLDAESRGTHDRILLSHDSGVHADLTVLPGIFFWCKLNKQEFSAEIFTENKYGAAVRNL